MSKLYTFSHYFKWSAEVDRSFRETALMALFLLLAVRLNLLMACNKYMLSTTVSLSENK